MFAGRRVNWSRLEFILDITGVTVRDDSVGRAEYSVEGEWIAWQALTPIGSESEFHDPGTETGNWIKNIWIRASETHLGNTWSFQWLERGISTSGTGAGAVRVEIDDFRLYARKEGTWRLLVGETRLYVGASLIATYGSATMDSTEIVSPRTCPLWSIPPEGVGVATAVNAINVSEAAAAGWVYSSEVEVEGSVRVGWRFVEGSDTVELPISWSVPSLPSLGSLASLPAMTGTTTWDAGIEVYAFERREDNWCSDAPGFALPRPYITNEQRSGRFWVWPVLDRSVHRMTNPSEALIVRGGFPRVDSRGSVFNYLSGSFFEELPGVTASAVSSPVALSEHTAFLEVVGNDLGVIEEPFTQSIYSPVRIAGSYAEAGTVEFSQAWGGTLPAACTAPDWRTGRIAKSSSVQWIDAYAVQTRGDAVTLPANPDIIPAFSHTEPTARFFLTWFCPHWSYALWFPPNTIDSDADDIPDQQDAWEVFTSPVAVEYWLASRQQYIKHPSLSGSERRNVILTEPLLESIWQRGGTGITQVWQAIYGLPTAPWGICNFEAQVPTVPASITLDSDSASLWSGLLNCTVDASGAAVVATPSGAGDIEVALDYAAFDTNPWLFAAMAAEFQMNWDTANISSCSVVAEGWDGERVEIVPNADRNTWKSWSLEGTAVKFAGSWHQAFGRGYVTDTGADVDADGISSATMADELRSTVFGLLPGRTCRRIVYIVTPTDSGQDVEISFPSFRHTSHRFIPEIAQQGVFVSPNGPGVRWGQVTWWDRGGDVFADPPVSSSPASMPTILDGLIARRLFFEGTSATDGLDTEIASIYDSGVEYTLTRKHMAVDPTDQGQSVHSFWVQGETSPVLGLVSALREVPPDAAFPVRDRDTDYQPTTDWVQKTWCAHFRDRYYTSATGPLTLSDGVFDWTDPDLNVSVIGWKIRSHARAVTNDESFFSVERASVVLANLRPWHGSFAIIEKDADPSGIHVSSIHTQNGQHITAWSDGEGIRVARSDFSVPYTYQSTYRFLLKNPGHTQPRLRLQLGTARVYLTFVAGTSLMEAFSDDDGATWSTPEEIETDIRWQDTWSDSRGFEGRAWFVPDTPPDGPGTIWVQVQGPGESAFGTAVVVGGGSPISFSDSTFKIIASPDHQDSWILSAIKDGDTEPSHFRSYDDGATWTEI